MSDDAPLQTALHDWHKGHGGRIVDFAGWAMPVQYTTIVDEHRAVRERAGLFDISHMGRLMFSGADVLPWIERVTTNHVAKLAPGQIQYSLMVDDRGGVLDDVLVYHTHDHGYAIVCNASNRAKVVAQLKAHKVGDGRTQLLDWTTGTTMIAIQGPKALGDPPAAVRPADRRTRLLPLDDRQRPLGPMHPQPDRLHRRGRLRDQLRRGDGGPDLGGPARRRQGRGRGRPLRPSGASRDTLRLRGRDAALRPRDGRDRQTRTSRPASGWAVKLDKGDFVGREALR